MLNIPSYMAGTDPWKSSKGIYKSPCNFLGKIGTIDESKKKYADFKDQNFGDGAIEILSFGGPLSLGMERSLKGRASRLWQTKKPFCINFNRKSEDKPLSTYFQIDGEYYNVVAPKSATVTKCMEVPKIKVMFKSKK